MAWCTTRLRYWTSTASPSTQTIANGEAVWTQSFTPGERQEFRVLYRSRGTSSWTFAAGRTTAQLRNFKLDVTTNTASVDFPAGTISPSHHEKTADGWHGKWSFDSMVSSADIAIDLPKKLNPGPVVSRIIFFAPVSLLFFFFVVAIVAAARTKDLHPMHYFMLGCAFFAFHLLFAYLVDHVAVFTSFGVAAVVSVALAVSYARLFVGWRFAVVEMGIAQLLYLVLFSFTFFMKGFTGLAITIGAVLTLFVIMQITGKLDWSEAFDFLRKDTDNRGHGYGMTPAAAGMPHGAMAVPMNVPRSGVEQANYQTWQRRQAAQYYGQQKNEAAAMSTEHSG